MRTIRLIFMLIKLKGVQNMAFRFDFFGTFIVDFSLFLFQIFSFNVIYSHVDSIGDWGQGHMLIFIGTFCLLDGIHMTFTFFGINSLPEKIIRGDLDYYLTKPGHPLIRLSFESANPSSATIILGGVGIIVYGIRILNLSPAPFLILMYILLILIMSLLWYDLGLIFRTLSFFIMTTIAALYLEETFLLTNMKTPGIIYQGAAKILFYLVVPYGIMATMPTQLLTGALSVTGLLYSLMIVSFFTWFAFYFWNLGVRHYKSASS